MLPLSFVLTLTTALAAPIPAERSAEDIEFFERRVRPLLVEHCLECHGGGGKKSKGGLRLTSRSAILEGGESGPAVDLEKTASSLILHAISYEDPERQMPPKRRLPPDAIAVFHEWIQRGLPDPRDDTQPQKIAETNNGTPSADHWAFRSPARVHPPVVQRTDWPKGDIDRFVLAKIEARKLQPASDATRRTWIRRVTLDVTGLPATAQEIASFLEDDHPDATQKVVDRLLASPRHGERWARHWLDVVRYAETSGHVTDRARPFVWKYRDWVVDALNDDVPYDRFVREHIAGDLLTTPRPGLRGETNVAPAATGFLWFHEMHFRPISPVGQRHDQIDAQIDIVGKAFLGLTTACARCHDHKFDPISQRDYYALAGIFASTEFGHARLSPDPFVDSDRADVTKTRRQIRELVAKEIKGVKKRQSRKTRTLAPITEDNYSIPSRGRLATLRASLAEIDSTSAHWAPAAVEGAAHDSHLHVRGNFKNPGDVVPRGFLRVLSTSATPDFEDSSGRLWLAEQIASHDNPLTARVIVNRLWQHHFGHGLVRSPNNFGALAEPPTHPELLDWLALRLAERAWSLKSLHREMLLTRTYGLNSEPAPGALESDPENRLVHHMPPRRLEAEAIRDSLLFVSGSLVAELGGESVEPYISPNTTSNKPGNIPKAGALDGKGRRSIYLRVRRNFCEPFIAAFDFPDPSSSVAARSVTVGPAQALAMLNSPLVHQEAKRWAERFTKSGDASIERAFETILGRPPSDDERSACREFLDENEARTQAWSDVAHLLFNSSEFLFRP